MKSEVKQLEVKLTGTLIVGPDHRIIFTDGEDRRFLVVLDNNTFRLNTTEYSTFNSQKTNDIFEQAINLAVKDIIRDSDDETKKGIILSFLLRHYMDLVESGDCGSSNWDPTKELIIQLAKDALGQ